MQLRYSFRLYPSPGQQVTLAGAFGCARVVFHDALAARKAAREAGEPWISDAELLERAWLGEASPVVLQQATRYCRPRDDLASVIRRSLDALQ